MKFLCRFDGWGKQHCRRIFRSWNCYGWGHTIPPEIRCLLPMYLVSKSAIVSIPDIDRSHADYNKKGGENTPQRMKYNARTAKKEKRQQEFYYKSFFMLLCSVGKSLRRQLIASFRIHERVKEALPIKCCT